MEVLLPKKNGLTLSVVKQTPFITVPKKGTADISVPHQTVDVTIKKGKGVAFSFVNNVLGSKNVVRLTYDEFQSLPSKNGSTWYAVTTTADELRYLYLGNTLIAKAELDSGAWGFAYSFPIIFGR